MKMKLLRKALLMSFYTTAVISLQLICSGLLLASTSYGQKSLKDVQISVDFKSEGLKEAFMKLERKTDFTFAYKDNLFFNTEDKKISEKFKNASMVEILESLSRTYHLHFKRVDNTINVRFVDKSRISVEEIYKATTQQRISGTITSSDNNEPLPGVSIIIKGTTTGTTTDINGAYSIEAASGDILQFSYIGFKTQEVEIGNQSLIDIALETDLDQLEEVVVVGYGTQSKKDISGSISSIKTEDIGNMPITGIDQLMSGQAAGVQISQSNAAPGGALRINIRGSVSISSGQQPLYVLDGFPISVGNNQVSNPLNNINPNDIESIEILKDASASAIYGSRASNGVVIITTKKGKAGKTQFDFDFYTGIQQVERKIDVLNASDFALLHTEARNNGYLDFFGEEGAQITDDNTTRSALGATSSALYHVEERFANPESLGEGTDWQDEIFRTAPITDTKLSARGGTENTKYYISGGYFNQQGVVIESGLQRYSFNSNLESQVANKVKLGFNLNSVYTESDIVNAEGSWHQGGVVTSALMMAPTMTVFDAEGNYQDIRDVYPSGGFVDIANPVQAAKETERTADRFRTTGTFFAEYEILEGLTFKGLLGADYSTYQEDKFSFSTLNQRAWGGNRAYQRKATSLNYLTEFTLNYVKTLEGGHNFNVLGGYTIQKETSESSRVESNDFPNDLVKDVTGGIITDYTSDPNEWSLLSFLSRVNYDYNGKYLISMSIRRDGSSRFGADTKWGNFPSISVAWRISEEAFMQGFDLIDDLKIRSSYGLTGNNAIGNYAAIGLLEADNYVVNGGIQLGQRTTSLQNDELGWENTTQFNVGLDLALFDGRLSVSTDYYDKYTKDLLLEVPVSSVTGVVEYITNIGEVSNRGWEFSLNSFNLVGAFKWSTSFNISGNRNTVEKLGVNNDPIFTGAIAGQSHVAMVGEPIGSYVGYRWDGLYLTQAELDNAPDVQTIGGRPNFIGDVRWKDIDGDGDVDLDDQTVLGSWQPDFVYGLTNNFSYKNFDMSIFIQGSQGNEVYNIQKRNLGIMVMYGNQYSETLNRYQSPENPGNGVLPQMKRAIANSSTTRSSDYYVDDASYLRIRNITLGYTLPKAILSKMKISSLRTYLSVQNIYTFTDYINYNPEVSATNTTSAFDTRINPLTPGIDYGSYPTARTFILGLNLTF